MTPSWTEAPTPIARDRRWATTALAMAWLALLGPVARAAALPASHPLQVAVVGAIGLVAVALVPARAWWARLGVAAATGLVLMPSQGQTIALWLAAGLVLATWVGQDREPLPGLGRPGAGAMAPCLALTGVAAYLGLAEANTWQPLVPLALAGAMPLLARVTGGAIDRVARRVGDAAGNLVALVLFSVLGAVIIVVPWIFQRLLRIDPLSPRRGWVRRERRPVQARQPWAPDVAADPLPAWTRLRGPIVLGMAGILLVGALTVDRLAHRQRLGDGRSSTQLLGLDGAAAGDVPAAHRDDPWYPAYRQDMAWVLNEKVALHPFDVYRVWNVRTRTVNVRDYHRIGWMPPPSSGPTLTVWLYGGDGVFGLDQRDDFTIASELSKVAADDGLRLVVVNRGEPAQLHWRASLRFAWDLAVDPKPDLAVFYEGAEEIAGAEALNDPPLGDIPTPYEPLIEHLWDEIQDVPKDQPSIQSGVLATLVRYPKVAKLSPAGVGRLAVTRYVRTLQLSDDTSKGSGVPVRYFWQPTRYTRPKTEAPSADPRTDAQRAREFAAARAALPARVTDLSDAFRGVGDPLFVDSIHHNERGAELVAEAMYRSLRPQLRRLAAAKAGGGS